MVGSGARRMAAGRGNATAVKDVFQSPRRRPAPGRCASAANGSGSCAARTAGAPGIATAARRRLRGPGGPDRVRRRRRRRHHRPAPKRRRDRRQAVPADHAGRRPDLDRAPSTVLLEPSASKYLGRAVARVRDVVAGLRRRRRRGRRGDRGAHQRRRRAHLRAAVTRATPRVGAPAVGRSSGPGTSKDSARVTDRRAFMSFGYGLTVTQDGGRRWRRSGTCRARRTAARS